jgi:glutamyl-Q tRNA(Asp) synthetase
MTAYIGRFAPSPTGALHAGSLVAALASWLDARAHGGTWLVRIEDVDTPRCVPGAAEEIFRQLAACGLIPDEQPVHQSHRSALYQTALDQLIALKAVYPCSCSRKDIEAALALSGTAKSRHGELIYPGTCRQGLAGPEARAWRFLTHIQEKKPQIADIESAKFAPSFIATIDGTMHWQDRRLGAQQQNVSAEVGDFVLKRADGLWAYQLAVVVDDTAQGITHVVRGEDLADNTARQILLQQALGQPTPQYLHTPLVLAPDGHKLSKQNGAQALALNNSAQVLAAIQQAVAALGLKTDAVCTPNDMLTTCVTQWRGLF